jgi:hypothetical protein
MRDLLNRWGPKTGKGWVKYAWRMIHHLLGGADGIARNKRDRVGVGALLHDETINAVTGNFCNQLFEIRCLFLFVKALFFLAAHVGEMFNLVIDVSSFKQVCNKNLAAIKQSEKRKQR